jgi:hypothetical protein
VALPPSSVWPLPLIVTLLVELMNGRAVAPESAMLAVTLIV